MPEARKTADALEVIALGYHLRFPADRPYALLSDAREEPWADLFLAPSLHARESLDDTASLEPPEVAQTPEGVRVIVAARGGRWAAKRLVFECADQTLRVSLEVEGEGAITDLHLFGGYYSGHLRWGSGFFQSGARFTGLFNPEPFSSERRALPAWESTVIDAMGTSLPGKGHWFFTPAPLMYAVSRSSIAGASLRADALGADQGGTPVLEHTVQNEGLSKNAVEDGAFSPELPPGPWMTMGLAVPPGQHTFTAFRFDALEGAFSLRLEYEGQTRVSGAWRSPGVIFGFDAPDPYTGLARYARDLEHLGLVNLQRRERPVWWLEPIQCGWGAQCAHAGRHGGRAPDHARQDLYDAWLGTLEANGVKPGTVVLDDKWQRQYGTNEADTAKWPDLAGWIARRHARGQRVLLWFKAWDAEGLPAEACVTDSAGRPIAADPSSPVYERILRDAVRRMLGPAGDGAGGYDADGFKVDFSARTPSGPGLRRHGREWGLELLHRLLWILRDEAKRVKADALVMTHAANPYFADVTDMIRLNDVNTAHEVVGQMTHRARVARAVCPQLPIDTDNWPMPNIKAWRAYTAAQPGLGIPSLYFATHVDSLEALTPEDYALVRRVWAEHRARLEHMGLEDSRDEWSARD